MRQTPSRTAEAVCFFRASEHRKPEGQRIVDDPHAETFLSPTFRALLKGVDLVGELAWTLSLGLRGFVLARHRWIDDALVAAAAAPGFDQVLLLGAGYDTRAWRLAPVLGGRPVWEVDHPATQQRKARLADAHLPPLPALRRVAVDFEREDLSERLHQEGFRDGARTFVVWEGVSMYLTRDAVKGTLSSLAARCGPGSRLAMDLLAFPDQHDWSATFHRASPQLLSVLGEPVSFVIHPDDVAGFVERLGWRLVDAATSEQLDQRYVRGNERVYGTMHMALLERLS